VHLVQCRKCFKSATVTEDGVDVHEAVDAAGCTCCPQKHHHGRAAGSAAEGGVPCRPLLITLLSGSVQAGTGVPDGTIVAGEVIRDQPELGMA
jgi:hypothetical protein